MKPYYEHAGITIYHGDCMEIIPTLRGIGSVITSPPYNLGGEPWPHLGNWKQGDSAGGKSKWRNGSDAASGIRYATHDDAMPWDGYVEWQQEFLRATWHILPGDGAIFYNHKPRVIGGKLWTPMELLPPAVILRQIIIWARPGGMNFNATAFVPTHEWIMVLARDLFRLRDRSVSGMGDVWQMAPAKSSHPAPFPIQLPSRVIQAIKAETILDPFMGHGTTLEAAKLHGRRAIGIEKSEEYCEIAAEKLRQEVLFPAESA